MFYWLDGGLGYVLSEELATDKLLHIATLAYRQMNPGIGEHSRASIFLAEGRDVLAHDVNLALNLCRNIKPN